MGRLQKRLVIAVANATAGFKADKKKMTLSIVSLLLTATVLISSTVCWYILQQAQGNTGAISLQTDNGLRVNDLGESLESAAKNSYLLPASSVDGRNLFFPTDGDSFSNQTSDMYFRTANAGDKNYSYIQYDFELMAEENYTSIYLDTSEKNDGSGKPYTYIGFKQGNEDWFSSNDLRTKSRAIRAALYYEGMENNKPIVFTTQQVSKETEAVSVIDNNDGSFLSTATQKAVPFRNYSYGQRQLAIMNKGEKRRFSLIIWLEGTLAECTDDLIGMEIDMNFKFTTSWENTEEIIFEDKTSGHAVEAYLNNHHNCALVLYYNDPNHNINYYKFNLYKREVSSTGNPQWYCNIPGNAVSSLEFRIVQLSNSSVPKDAVSDGTNSFVWNQTAQGQSTTNRIDATKYIADSVGATSYGHWYDGAIEDMGGGHDIDDGDIDDDDW